MTISVLTSKKFMRGYAMGFGVLVGMSISLSASAADSNGCKWTSGKYVYDGTKKVLVESVYDCPKVGQVLYTRDKKGNFGTAKINSYGTWGDSASTKVAIGAASLDAEGRPSHDAIFEALKSQVEAKKPSDKPQVRFDGSKQGGGAAMEQIQHQQSKDLYKRRSQILENFKSAQTLAAAEGSGSKPTAPTISPGIVIPVLPTVVVTVLEPVAESAVDSAADEAQAKAEAEKEAAKAARKAAAAKKKAERKVAEAKKKEESEVADAGAAAEKPTASVGPATANGKSVAKSVEGDPPNAADKKVDAGSAPGSRESSVASPVTVPAGAAAKPVAGEKGGPAVVGDPPSTAAAIVTNPVNKEVSALGELASKYLDTDRKIVEQQTIVDAQDATVKSEPCQDLLAKKSLSLQEEDDDQLRQQWEDCRSAQTKRNTAQSEVGRLTEERLTVQNNYRDAVAKAKVDPSKIKCCGDDASDPEFCGAVAPLHVWDPQAAKENGGEIFGTGGANKKAWKPGLKSICGSDTKFTLACMGQSKCRYTDGDFQFEFETNVACGAQVPTDCLKVTECLKQSGALEQSEGKIVRDDFYMSSQRKTGAKAAPAK